MCLPVSSFVLELSDSFSDKLEIPGDPGALRSPRYQTIQRQAELGFVLLTVLVTAPTASGM